MRADMALKQPGRISGAGSFNNARNLVVARAGLA
jgi:hypothetical protein